MPVSFPRKAPLDIVPASLINDIEVAVEDLYPTAAGDVVTGGVGGAAGVTNLPAGGIMIGRSGNRPGMRLAEQLGARSIMDPRYDAKGDGVADDIAAINDAFTAAGTFGAIVIPPPSDHYLISASIVPLSRQHVFGPGSNQASANTGHIRPVAGFSDAIITSLVTVEDLVIRDLSLRGRASLASPLPGSKGIFFTDAVDLKLRGVSLHGFGEPAVHITGGNSGTFEQLQVSGSLYNRTAYMDYAGAVDIATNDPRLVEVIASVSALGTEANGGFINGWLAAIVVRGSAGWIERCTMQISQVGLVLTNSTTGHWRIWGNRADLNKGHGYIIDTPNNIIVGNDSLRNGQAADDTYDGFVISAAGNQFEANAVTHLAADANHCRHGFTDSTNAGAGDDHNKYVANRVDDQRQKRFNPTGTGRHHWVESGTAVTSITAAYTTTPADEVVLCGGTVDYTVTLQSAIGVPRRPQTIKRVDTAIITVDAAGSQTIDKALTKVLASDGAFVQIVPDGSDWQIIAQGGTVT